MPNPLSFVHLQRGLAPRPATAGLPAAPVPAPHAAEKLKLARSAQDFESLLLGTMLRTMRATTETLADDEGTTGNGLMRDVMDEHLAVALARSGGMGLGHALDQELEARLLRQEPRPDSTPADPEGGIR